MSWKNWEGSLEEKSHIEKDPRISFFQSEVFRIRNPWNSNWYLQNVPQSNDVGDIQIKTDMLLHNLGFFSYYGTHVHGIYSEKGDGVWSGPGLGLWPPWNLGPAPIFQPDFPAKYVSQEDFWTLWGPSLSCQPHSQTMKELPCSSLGLFQMAYWLLPMSVGSFRTLFMFQVPCPSHSKSWKYWSGPRVLINQRLPVQASLIQLPPRQLLEQVPRNNRSWSQDPWLSIEG